MTNEGEFRSDHELFKVFSQHFLGGTEENQEPSLGEVAVSRSETKSATSRLRRANDNCIAATFGVYVLILGL